MRTSDAFPSPYLSRDDVVNPVVATVADVRPQSVRGEHGTEDKPVMFFQERQMKPFILNSTNWKTIRTTYGDESDEWIGKPIEIYFDPGVLFGDNQVGGLRVRVPGRRATQKRMVAEPAGAGAPESDTPQASTQRSAMIAFAAAAKENNPGATREWIRQEWVKAVVVLVPDIPEAEFTAAEWEVIEKRARHYFEQDIPF